MYICWKSRLWLEFGEYIFYNITMIYGVILWKKRLEEDGNITFLHKIKEGSVDKSYGIHVAKLAQLPDSLIKRADEILMSYENKKTKKEVVSQISMNLEESVAPINKYDIIKKKLDDINPLELYKRT